MFSLVEECKLCVMLVLWPEQDQTHSHFYLICSKCRPDCPSDFKRGRRQTHREKERELWCDIQGSALLLTLLGRPVFHWFLSTSLSHVHVSHSLSDSHTGQRKAI